MATTQKWTTPEAIQTALSTELNSLANNAYTAVSAAIDNLTDLYEFMALEMNMASVTTGSGAPYWTAYLIPSLDDTSYGDGGGSTAPPAHAQIATFGLRASVAAAQRHVIADIPIPPIKFKLIVLNGAGVTLASSGSTLKYRRYNQQTV